MFDEFDPDGATATRPQDYLVTKDGSPFALLNAAPALAEYTLNGFRRADPQACWNCERR